MTFGDPSQAGPGRVHDRDLVQADRDRHGQHDRDRWHHDHPARDPRRSAGRELERRRQLDPGHQHAGNVIAADFEGRRPGAPARTTRSAARPRSPTTSGTTPPPPMTARPGRCTSMATSRRQLSTTCRRVSTPAPTRSRPWAGHDDHLRDRQYDDPRPLRRRHRRSPGLGPCPDPPRSWPTETSNSPPAPVSWRAGASTRAAGTNVADSITHAICRRRTITGSGYSWVPGFVPPARQRAPDAPTLNAPANGSTGVGPSPTLDIGVSDPDGDPLTVTFYGRPLRGQLRSARPASSVTSGSNVTTPWPNLGAGQTYEWYATVSDGNGHDDRPDLDVPHRGQRRSGVRRRR